MNIDNKLEQFAQRHSRHALETGIIEIHPNKILAFGRWVLEPSAKGCQVSTCDQIVGDFADRRTAMSWCVAEKNHNYRLSWAISTLDAKKCMLGDDIDTRRQLAQRGRNVQHNEMVMTKLQPKIKYYQAIKSELEKCIDLAKYMQIRGFSNETSRPSRGSSH